MVTVSLNFVFDKNGGFQVFLIIRDAEFSKNKVGGWHYRGGPAENKFPSKNLNLSVNVVGGLIGGDGFDLTSDYEGRIRDYQLGLEWVGGDYYQGYNEKTDNFDGENFWGLDIGWSGGIPLTIGGIALKSEPLFGMGRIDLTPGTNRKNVFRMFNHNSQ